MTPTVVIGCGAAKLASPAPACDLYTGQQFQMSRRAVEHLELNWIVLSARHGLLRPEEIVAPYDYVLGHSQKSIRVLTSVLRHQRNKWPQGLIESWCTRRYTQAMREAGMPVVAAPLEGLGVGECYTWLYERMSK